MFIGYEPNKVAVRSPSSFGSILAYTVGSRECSRSTLITLLLLREILSLLQSYLAT
jgi:hypothetical protein